MRVSVRHLERDADEQRDDRAVHVAVDDAAELVQAAAEVARVPGELVDPLAPYARTLTPSHALSHQHRCALERRAKRATQRKRSPSLEFEFEFQEHMITEALVQRMDTIVGAVLSEDDAHRGEDLLRHRWRHGRAVHRVVRVHAQVLDQPLRTSTHELELH